MIPLHLHISGFLSYRDPVDLEFDSFELACISGHNGAGKSSLLDAITWVLFGEARGRTDVINLNLDVKAAEVSLTFKYEGNVFRVQRTLPRGKSTVLEFQVLNQTMDDGPLTIDHGQWKALTEKTTRDTQARIEQTLRLDYETFINASFFLQGKADQFTQKKASERKAVLSTILGLEVWDIYKDRTAEKRRLLETDVQGIDGRVAEIDAELGEEDTRRNRLAELENSLKQLSSARVVQEAALENIRKNIALFDQQRKLAETLFTSLERSRTTLTSLESRHAEKESEHAEYADLVNRAKEIESAYKAWQNTRKELEALDTVAQEFREYEKERAPLLERIAVEKATLEEEQRGLFIEAEEINNQNSSIKQLSADIEMANNALDEASAKVAERTELEKSRNDARERQAALKAENEALKESMNSLNTDTELTVERLTPAIFPVFILALTGGLPTPELNDYAQYVMRPTLARVPGTGAIEVLSSDTREIEVILDPLKLNSAGLTVADVAAKLRTQNQLLPVGRFAEGGQQHLALASGQWTNLDQIGASPIIVKDGSTIRVTDLGRVVPGAPDRTLLVTGNGRDAVSISISQQIGANILNLKAGLEQSLRDLAHSLPAGLTVTKVYDLAEFVASAIANVRDAILIGGFLAILVLIVFLGDLRLTMIAAVTLPMAVIPTFAFLHILGGSVNLMSMGGLAVAIGLVIDDAVVVVENIHRRASEGVESVAGAVQELMAPLTSSTLTTVVVFAPLGLLSGVAGQFFRALSMSLTVAVLLSLFLSVTVVPLLARWASRHHKHELNRQEGRLGQWYGRSLDSVVKRPFLAVVAACVLAVSTATLFYAVGTGFLPPADEGGFVIDYLTPAGSALDETDRQVRTLEKIVSSTPDVAAYSRRTGSELGLFATAQNTGDILVRLKPRSQRSRSAEDIITDMRPKLQEAAPLVEIEFVQLLQDMLGDLEGSPTPIDIKIFGDDPDVLASLSEPIEELLGKIDGVVDVVGMQRGNPEVTWEIDSVAAARFGLTVEDVSNQLAAAWLGQVTTELRLADRMIPVRVRLPDAVRLDPTKLPDTLLRTPDGTLVPVRVLAQVKRSNGQSELLRENLRGMASITGHLEGRDLGSAIADVQREMRSITLPIGYTYEIGGQYESQRQAFRELLVVFAIGTFLVMTVLVVHFRAFVPASLILIAAPLSLCGALALLLLTGTDLNVSSAMGLILLVGLVVKNGIMLLDFSERLHEAGEPFEAAIAHAGRIRLRPILMTTFCTLFGLLPLALGLGSGAELQKPLALAVIGGLALSTPVTLLIVPGLYAAIQRRSRWSLVVGR